MGVFGSFAQSEQTIESDIDLVVEFENSKKNIHTFFQLRRLCFLASWLRPLTFQP